MNCGVFKRWLSDFLLLPGSKLLCVEGQTGVRDFCLTFVISLTFSRGSRRLGHIRQIHICCITFNRKKNCNATFDMKFLSFFKMRRSFRSCLSNCCTISIFGCISEVSCVVCAPLLLSDSFRYFTDLNLTAEHLRSLLFTTPRLHVRPSSPVTLSSAHTVFYRKLLVFPALLVLLSFMNTNLMLLC